MEAPECPVCLQSYDGDSTVPRVLSCGHTTCEECLTKLPKKFPNTIRCPACTVLVKFPPQGPSSLPKNIDLLRLFPSITTSEPNRSYKKPVEFLNPSWPDEFYTTWKKRILLQNDVVSTVSLSLLRVASFQHDDDDDCESVIKYSYLHRIMSCLWSMSEEERDEIETIISVKQRGVSKFFGLWGDLKNGVLYLVGEKLIDFSWEELDNLHDTSCIAIISKQICEALMSLHKEGMIIGCLSVSCVKFDEFENAYVDLIEVIETGRNVYRLIDEESSNSEVILVRLLEKGIFMSSEVLMELLKERKMASSVSCSSDVWPVCFLLLKLLLGKRLTEEVIEEGIEDLLVLYTSIADKLSSMLESELEEKFKPTIEILRQCCCLDPQARPALIDLWKCSKELVMNPMFSSKIGLRKPVSGKKKESCFVLGELCRLGYEEPKEKLPEMENDGGEAEKSKVDIDFAERLSEGKVKSKDLRGHEQWVTGLAIGGGFLFSSSVDKTIRTWSLKDFSHVHTYKGHEDRVMALIYIEQTEECVSADSGGGIFVWNTSFPLEEQPVRKWYEPKDWRYTGIRALAYSEDGYVYSGSGDNTIKAWSLQDGSLVCTMTGHKSVVSALVVINGVLYSGSWDGTIRLWSLSDHSLLMVLGEETPGIVRPILSLAAEEQTLVAGYESGYVQIWRDDTLMKSIQIQSKTILSIAVNGKWLFTGGWDKSINVQELSGDETSLECSHVGTIPGSSSITSLVYWEGKLFAGFSDSTIKVYYSGR